MLSSLTLIKLHLRTYTVMCIYSIVQEYVGMSVNSAVIFAVTDPESRSPTRQLQMTTCRANRKVFLHSFRVHALDTSTHPTEIDPSTTIYTHTYVYMNIQYMHTGTHFNPVYYSWGTQIAKIMPHLLTHLISWCECSL